jgi:hypothetical protein
MFANRSRAVWLGVFVVCVAVATSASGQRIGRSRIRSSEYRVKVVSHFGIPVTIGIFGRQKDATFRVTFDGGRTGPDVYSLSLLSGERVICVWDTRGSLLFISDVVVDRSGTLDIPDVGYAPARGGAAERGEARDGGAGPDIPRLRIRE